MTEVQLILRFPEPLATEVQRALNKSKESLDIKLNPEETTNKSNLAEPNRASVKFGDRTFPALIGRLPCNIETHKTFDHVHFFKAGDIAEMVHVFETEEEREYAQYEMSQIEGYKRTFLSGITPPTSQIIRRKFLKTRSQKPKAKEVVSAVEEELQKYTKQEEVIEEFEEVVDFEEYMADADHPNGKIFAFNTTELTNDTVMFQNHPEASDKEMLQLIEEKEKKHEMANVAQTQGGHLLTTANEMEIDVVDEVNTTETNQVVMERDDEDEDDSDDSDDDDFLKDLESGVQSDD